MNKKVILKYVMAVFLMMGAGFLQAAVIKGTVIDQQNKEPLPGATIQALNQKGGAVADMDGKFYLSLPKGKYTLVAKFIGYKETQVENVSLNKDTISLVIEMAPNSQTLKGVTVSAVQRRGSEVSQIQAMRTSAVVQSGVSAQQVERTQDKDASEVIRRVPGISIIDDKFVMVRGLSQRYNNVWLNGGAVPSSEADSRSFSFDIIPSSQIDNMTIIKSPAPEYPADFTGGFILIYTKQQPVKGGLNVGIGVGVNDQTHFRKITTTYGHSAFPAATLNTYDGFERRINVTGNAFNNDWRTRQVMPVPDLKANVSYTHTWQGKKGATVGLLSTFNASNSYKTILNMENSLYGPYDITNDKHVPLRKATDNQFSHDIRLGGMLNLSYKPRDQRHYFEWKNIANQIIKDRYSERVGFNAQPDNLHDMEYYYSSRPTYNTQFTGKHSFDEQSVDYSVGYAFARRDLPDRRLIQLTDRTDQTMGIYRISRDFTRLNEHIASVGSNYRKTFQWGAIKPELKTGVYGEYCTRSYKTRQFQYGWQPDNTLPKGFMFEPDVQNKTLIEANYGADKLYMYEEVNFLNNYGGIRSQASGYAGLNIPFWKMVIYAGVRYEFCRQILQMNARQYEESIQNTYYDYHDFFPSVNAVLRLTEAHQLRAAYGRSTNRPEFRELSSSVFYDFDLGSNVMGNPMLKAAYIHNYDFRYEYYPSKGEQVSVALFYKQFNNPIEWTYTVAGGTDLIYSFINALGADNYGVEVDIRKNLDFMKLKNFSLSFNGAFIKSKVRFEKGSNNLDRPMQGQSPYLINVGLFYQHPDKGWSAAVLYNRIGKRIIGVGNRFGTDSEGTARNIPNSYEYPRNGLDLSVGKKIGHWNLKLSVRDVLAERYEFKQIEVINTGVGEKTIEEVTRTYRPGRSFNISVSYEF